MIRVIGLFLIAEGILSILYSQDQQPISNFGRLLRIGAGIFLVTEGTTVRL